jgi:hypothetical protein
VKFALIYDCCEPKSFYVKDKVAYDFQNNEPCEHIHAVSPSCFIGHYNLTFLWEGGHFLNLQEFIEGGINFPDVDFDLILYANERVGLDDELYDLYRVDRLRDKYPNAKIYGWTKEMVLSVHNREVRSRNRIKFLKECDDIVIGAITTMRDIDPLKDLEKSLNVKFKNYISCPINIEYYYDKFYSSEKEESIFAYYPNPMHRRGETYEFAEYIGNKYNIPVKKKLLKYGREFYYLTLKEFVELWSPCSFHFNLDPEQIQPGQHCIQVANVGSINIGGVNESHHILFPETATCDKKILEEKFVEYLKDLDKRFEVIEYAWNKLNEIYSYKVVEKQLLEIMEN